MRLSMPMGRALLGFGLAATVLLGCEKFVEEEGDGGRTEEGAPEDLALQLSVKATEECRGLRDEVLAARRAGKPTAKAAERADRAEKAFLAKCVEEVEPRSDGRTIVLPRDLELDDHSRCRWIVSQIEGGRDELTVKFRYYCPENCDTLAAIDSARHDKFCRDSRPDCEHLTRKLSRLDSNSAEYHRLLRYLGETCWNVPPEPPYLDSLRYCDTLRILLARADTNSYRYDSLAAELRRRCGIFVPPVSPCDSLRAFLARANLTREGARLAKNQLDSLCGPPVIDTLGLCDSLRQRILLGFHSPAERNRQRLLLDSLCGPPIIDTLHFCDSLRLGLLRIDTTSPHGDSLFLELRRHCGLVPIPITPCDSLRRVMAVTLYTKEGWERVNRELRQLCGGGIDTICPPPDVPPRGTCDSLFKEWMRLDPSSPAYGPAKARYHSACVDTLLPQGFCDGLKRRMSLADTASREYAGLRETYRRRCDRIGID